MMHPDDYKIRCDKHNFKPYEYCEMCMIRNSLQATIESQTEMVERACASMNLAISVIHDCLDNLMSRISKLEK
jgi:hypothetical protein